MGACDRDVPISASLDRPSVHIVEVSPTQGELLPLERSLRVRFDRYLLPSTIARQAVLVTAGLIDPDSGQPSAGSYFFEPRWDPYERVATFSLGPGGRWVGGVLHTAKLRAPDNDQDATGFRAWDGAPLDESRTYTFIVTDSVSNPNHDVDDEWPKATYCNDVVGPPTLPSIRGVLSTCASSGCHGGSAPAMGLDLSSRSGIERTAFMVATKESVPTAVEGEVLSNPSHFGEGMPRIEPRSAGNSYLMYKLLINPGNYGTPSGEDTSAFEPGLTNPTPPSSDELRRLRGSFVQMSPMPIGGFLKVEQMRALVAWIGQGAPLADCDQR